MKKYLIAFEDGELVVQAEELLEPPSFSFMGPWVVSDPDTKEKIFINSACIQFIKELKNDNR